MAYLPQRLEVGTYYLKELEAPYGYVLNTELTKFEVDQANTWDQLITWQEKDQEVKGVLKGRWHRAVQGTLSWQVPYR